MYALVDCNNFYASCERVFHPPLNEKPIVVLSNNDGCVIARSNEAKQLGIPMGAPAFKFEKICQEMQVNIFSSNYALYADMSNRVVTILRKYTPDLEVYSIDESFLRLDGFVGINFITYCQKIKQDILKSTLLPTCVGVAPTKALAKVANRIAKKYPHLDGVYVIDSEQKRIKALKWLAIEDVWGIGRKLSKKLQQMGVIKAYDFTQLSDDFIQKHFSVVELRLKKELQGISVLKLEEVVNKKSIATTRSFDKNYTDKSYLQERISTFAVTCAEKLRKQQSNCRVVTVFINTNRFQQAQKQYYNARSITIPYDTNSSFDIVKYAQKAFHSIFEEGYEYKKAGVILSGIQSQNQQLSLFEHANPKHASLMKVMDALNTKYHEKKIKIASQALDKTWKMRQQRLSPNYTTKWNDILVIK